MNIANKGIVKWCAGIFAGVIIFLITSFLAGNDLEGVSFINSKLRTGFPIVFWFLLKLLTSKIAIFIYGIILGVIATITIVSVREKNSETSQSHIPSQRELHKLSKATEQLVEGLLEIQQYGILRTDIHRRNNNKIFYENVFSGLRNIGILDNAEPEFGTVSGQSLEELRNYLSQVSIHLGNHHFDKAKSVRFPYF